MHSKYIENWQWFLSGPLDWHDSQDSRETDRFQYSPL